jgi:parallel beta-helix repeat protein
MKNRRTSSLGVLVVVLILLALAMPASAAGKGNTLRVGPGPDYDYATIQDAVNAAKQGSKILVYPGVYEENVLINKNNLWILAQGEGVVVDPPGEPGVPTGGFMVNADHVTIRGFEILAGRNCAVGIQFEGSHNTFAENGVFFDPTSGCMDHTAVTCRDEDGGSDYNTFEDNEIGGGYAIVILAIGPDAVNKGNVIRNNEIFGFDLAIDVYNGEGFTISGNTIGGEFGACVSVAAGNNVPQGNHRISNNTVLQCGGETGGGGIELTAENGAVLTHNHIGSNNVSKVAGPGIALTAEDGASLAHNQITSNDVSQVFWTGISLGTEGSGTASNNLLRDNLVHNNFADGVWLQSGADNNRVLNNEISTHTHVGLVVEGDNNLFVGNWIWNNGEDVLDLGEGNKWRNNTVGN